MTKIKEPIAKAIAQGIDCPIAGAGGGATPLLTDLVAYWDLSEASGTRNDSHSNGYHLTDNNTVGQAAGVGGGQNATDHIKANAEYLSRTGSNDISGLTDTDFSFAFWVYHESPCMGSITGIHCLNGGANEGWQYTKRANDKPRILVANGSGSFGFKEHTTTLVVDTWYFIYCYYDDAADEIGISINNGAAQTAACVGHTTGTNAFEVGRYTVSDVLDGRHQALGIWGRKLTAAELTWLYNSGTSARLYADVSTYTG